VAAPTRWEPPAPVTAEHIGAVAERMRAALETLLVDVSDAILDSAPALAADPVLAAATRASTAANVTRWVTATIARPGAPVRIDLPPEALDLARDVVRRGMDRDALLTSYRTGQNVTWRAWMRFARDEGLDGDDLVAVLDVASRSLFAFVDDTLNALAQQMERERDELLGGALARRRETVMLILDGAPITQARASARLGYELGRVHTALILWAGDRAADQGELEAAAGGIARAVGSARPFTVPAGVAALWAWLSGTAPAAAGLRTAADAITPGIRIAAGSPLAGINGFRASHREALAAQRLLMRNADGPRLTTYADVQVVSLAAQDEPRAAAFMTTTLGRLLGADADLRETVRVYLHEDASAARAASVLHTHRNTVLKRIARADALLPQPLARRGLEVRLALELQRWLG
jgi:DNA-binding PucR family transcriptional regulator